PGVPGTVRPWLAIIFAASPMPYDNSHDWKRATSGSARYAHTAAASPWRKRRRHSRGDRNSMESSTLRPLPSTVFGDERVLLPGLDVRHSASSGISDSRGDGYGAAGRALDALSN